MSQCHYKTDGVYAETSKCWMRNFCSYTYIHVYVHVHKTRSGHVKNAFMSLPVIEIFHYYIPIYFFAKKYVISNQAWTFCTEVRSAMHMQRRSPVNRYGSIRYKPWCFDVCVLWNLKKSAWKWRNRIRMYIDSTPVLIQIWFIDVGFFLIKCRKNLTNVPNRRFNILHGKDQL